MRASGIGIIARVDNTMRTVVGAKRFPIGNCSGLVGWIGQKWFGGRWRVGRLLCHTGGMDAEIDLNAASHDVLITIIVRLEKRIAQLESQAKTRGSGRMRCLKPKAGRKPAQAKAPGKPRPHGEHPGYANEIANPHIEYGLATTIKKAERP